MKQVKRDYYEKTLQSVAGVPDIIRLYGCRGSGKTTLLASFMKAMHKMGPKAHLIPISFEDPAFDQLREYQALHDYIEERWEKGKNNYLIIDEMPGEAGFIIALNSLHALDKYSIYIALSNDFLFEDKMATLLTGRICPVSVYPFSLREYMDCFELSDPQKALSAYAQEGGFSAAYALGSKQEKEAYRAGLLESLLAPIYSRHSGRQNARRSDALLEYLLESTGRLISISDMVRP